MEIIKEYDDFAGHCYVIRYKGISYFVYEEELEAFMASSLFMLLK